MPSVTLLGLAQDGGVPQAGCSCPRCMDVHDGKKPELYPVALGIIDDDGEFHLIEASRTLCRQLRLWATSTAHLGHDLPIISPIKSVTLTHLHLGHIDGIGLFGREVMGAPTESIRLISGKPVIDEIEKKSYLQPFAPEVISNGSRVELGTGVALEFHRVPHRDHECGETYGIIVRGEQKSILFLPDHDTYEETLNYHDKTSVREWLKSLEIDVALIDGTFFTVEEIAGRRSDSKTIPHPTISETLKLLGQRTNDDPDVIFIHINHTNPILDDEMKTLEVEQLGWKIGTQGQTWII